MSKEYSTYIDELEKAGKEVLDADLSIQFKGYTDSTTAIMRYDQVFNFLLKFESFGSIMDLGVGVGAMWTYYVETSKIQDLMSKGLTRVILVEDHIPYQGLVKETVENLRSQGLEASFLSADFFEIFSNIENHLTNPIDIVTSVGALNYYGAVKLTALLERIIALSDIGVVIETNIQSPTTTAHPGNLNPSLDFLYQVFYDLVLGKGGSASIDLSLLKKYTSIWRIPT